MVEVDYKIYRVYYQEKRKERYFMSDLKYGRVKENYKLGREVSLEYLCEKGFVIARDDIVWNEIEKNIKLEKLYVAIETLNIWEKMVLKKIFWEELSEKRVAEDLKIPRSTLHYRVKKIYEKIRKTIENL